MPSTVNVWLPSERPAYCAVPWPVQGANAWPSRLHWTASTVLAATNWKLALVLVVTVGGCAEIAIEIGVGSSAIVETVPVTVGPPGWLGNGGNTGLVWP